MVRLSGTKLYRAFPELDGYPDDDCRAYVRGAIRRDRWQLLGLMAGGFVGGYVIAVPLIFFVLIQLGNRAFFERHQWENGSIIGLVVVLGASVSMLGSGPLLALALRDTWLRRAMRRRLRGASCPACGHSLLGMVPRMEPSIGRRAVRCPECGALAPVGERGIDEDALVVGSRTRAADADGADIVEIHPLVRQYPDLAGLDEAQRSSVISRVEGRARSRQRIALLLAALVGAIPAGLIYLFLATDVLEGTRGAQSATQIPGWIRALREFVAGLRGVASESFVRGLALVFGLLALWVTGAWTKRLVRGALQARDVARALRELEP